MRRRLLAPLGAATVLVTAVGLFAGSAVAAPTTPSDEDLAAVQGQADDTAAAIAGLEAELVTNQAALDAATIEALIAAEDHAVAVVALEDAETEQAEASEARDAAHLELDEASAALAELAMASYRSGGSLAQLGSLMSADGIEDALVEATTYQVLGDSNAQAHDRYAAAEIAATTADDRAAAAVTERATAAEELEAASAAADETAAAAADLVASNSARRDELIVELAGLRETTVEMEAERQAAAEAARVEAANAEAAEDLGVAPPAAAPEAPAAPDAPDAPAPAPTTTAPAPAPTTTAPAPAPSTPAPAPTTPKPKPTTPKPTPPPVTTPPPSSSAGAAALAWARTQLGKPYVYGAAGPNSYDCSGLTMQAYANAGVTIPRNSRAQYSVGDRVPVGQMQPGDLFFYSSNGSASGIYHVAIYAGNGMRLHAPSPGKTVELVSMWWPNVMPYAVRP